MSQPWRAGKRLTDLQGRTQCTVSFRIRPRATGNVGPNTRNLNAESFLESLPEESIYNCSGRAKQNKLSVSEMTQVLLETEMPSRWG